MITYHIADLEFSDSSVEIALVSAPPLLLQMMAPPRTLPRRRRGQPRRRPAEPRGAPLPAKTRSAAPQVPRIQKPVFARTRKFAVPLGRVALLKIREHGLRARPGFRTRGGRGWGAGHFRGICGAASPDPAQPRPRPRTSVGARSGQAPRSSAAGPDAAPTPRPAARWPCPGGDLAGARCPLAGSGDRKMAGSTQR